MHALFALVLALTLATPLAAQFTASVGVALPVGPFGRTETGTEDGFAKPGFTALIYLDAPLALEGTRGLAFTSTTGAFIFPFEDATFSPFPPDQQASPALGPQSDVESWIAIPVLVGMRYEWAGVNEDVALIGALQGGVGIVRLPGVTYTLAESPDLYRLDQDAGLSATLASSAGVAVALFDRLELGVHAFWFAAPSFSVDQTLLDQTVDPGALPETTTVEFKRPVAATAFTLGYRF